MPTVFGKVLVFFQTRQQLYRRVFNTPEGQYVLADLYKFCGVERQAYNLTNTNDVLFAEGMRRVALHIHQALNESADDMLKRAENYDDRPETEEGASQTHAQEYGF